MIVFKTIEELTSEFGSNHHPSKQGGIGRIHSATYSKIGGLNINELSIIGISAVGENGDWVDKKCSKAKAIAKVGRWLLREEGQVEINGVENPIRIGIIINKAQTNRFGFKTGGCDFDNDSTFILVPKYAVKLGHCMEEEKINEVDGIVPGDYIVDNGTVHEISGFFKSGKITYVNSAAICVNVKGAKVVKRETLKDIL